MTIRRITWAEAEQLVPGVEAEWRSMLGQEGTCVPPTGHDWRVEVKEWPSGPKLHVVMCDPSGTWESPPTWVRHEDGWTHPIPMKKDALKWSTFLIEYVDYSKMHGPEMPPMYGPRRRLLFENLLEEADRFEPSKNRIYPMTPTRHTHFIDVAGSGSVK